MISLCTRAIGLLSRGHRMDYFELYFLLFDGALSYFVLPFQKVYPVHILYDLALHAHYLLLIIEDLIFLFLDINSDFVGLVFQHVKGLP